MQSYSAANFSMSNDYQSSSLFIFYSKRFQSPEKTFSGSKAGFFFFFFGVVLDLHGLRACRIAFRTRAG